MLRHVARKYLPRSVKRGLRRLHAGWKRFKNVLLLPSLKYRTGLCVHLGCGDDILPGFTNIDCRATRATDYILDLNEPNCFHPNSIKCFFSHAFFEHLYRDKRRTHLQCLVKALDPETGFCCYIGLPYFRNIAKLYLTGAPGVVGDTFDLYNVYRYTHGDPENAPDWWLEQLHKSLFDEDELSELLSQAGFASYLLFSYCYVGERGKPVNIGFFASKRQHASSQLYADCVQFLKRYAANKVLLDTLEILPSTSSSRSAI